MAGNGVRGKPNGNKIPKRKRDANSNGSNLTENTGELKPELDGVLPVQKKPRIGPVVSAGTSSNLNKRNTMLLEKLSSLITSVKVASQVTDNKSDILESEAATNGLYMERSGDSFFIWMSNCSKALKIRFELLAGFGVDLEDLNVTKPLITFSHGFDSDDNWTDVKEILAELFAYHGTSVDCTADADYLYAFTKIFGKVELYIYKIHSIPDLEAGSMKLQQMGPTFVLRPVEIIRPNGQYYFQGRGKRKRADSLKLASYGSYVDEAHPEAIPHRVECLNSDILLPMPHDMSEWEGFNTTLTEFFERYHAFKEKLVPGTGLHAGVAPTPEQRYYHLLLPFKIFARSLIIEVTDMIEKKEYCFSKLKSQHIRFKGKTLAILGAKMIPYTEKDAERNLKRVGKIIKRKLTHLGLGKDSFPGDLKAVLKLLREDVMDHCTLARNSVVWMDWQSRCHVMNDLFGDFMYALSAKEQLNVGKSFPRFDVWVKKVKENWLLNDCRNFSLPKNKNEAQMETWYANMAEKLSADLNISRKKAKALYNLQQCFKNIRNPFHHLRISAKKLKFRELSPKDIDLVVSSCFAEVYAMAQQEVPRRFSLRKSVEEEYASYKRFEVYFQGTEAVKFETEDEK